jgi:hypothetical protein
MLGNYGRRLLANGTDRESDIEDAIAFFCISIFLGIVSR